MTKTKNMLPTGIEDYLPNECYNKNLLENNISDIFQKSGYKKIEPPTVEYIDTFNFNKFSHMEKIFKLIDFDGKVLALRSDPTLQITRIAATKLHGGINRLFYIVNSYEFSNTISQNARTREFAQIGLELMGVCGSLADSEALTMAIEAMISVGIEDFKIDIGQVNFFNGMMSNYGLDENIIELVRERVNNKDLDGVKKILETQKLSDDAIKNILKIPNLFGGYEVIDIAKKISNNKRSDAALANIKEIFDILKQYGYQKYISVDLGMLPNLSYYSGIIFRGLAKGVGAAILEGGRYDGLSTYFGANIPSVGFAIGLKRLMEAKNIVKGYEIQSSSDYAYIVNDGVEEKAFEYIKKLKKQGLSIERAYAQNKNELIEYCKLQKIKKYIIFDIDNIIEGEICIN